MWSRNINFWFAENGPNQNLGNTFAGQKGWKLRSQQLSVVCESVIILYAVVGMLSVESTNIQTYNKMASSLRCSLVELILRVAQLVSFHYWKVNYLNVCNAKLKYLLSTQLLQ